MLPSADSIVYTAIFGNYDVLRPPVSVPGVKFLCFTDADISCGGWDVIKVPAKFRSPRLSAKYYKVMAHEVITCRRSLWIDGRLQFAGLGGGWDSMQHNIAFCRHHARNCVYDEANLCISHAIGDPPKIREAIAKYRVEGYPANNGLYRGGTIWRKHVPEVAEFNAAWWRAIVDGSVRDQISLPIVLWRTSLQFDIFPFKSLNTSDRSHGPSPVIIPHEHAIQNYCEKH